MSGFNLLGFGTTLRELVDERRNDVAVIDSILRRLNGGRGFTQSAAPSVGKNESSVWVAQASGTLDGQAYEQGDLLYTANVNGVSKTTIIVDWSAA